MSHAAPGQLAAYNSLQDKHLSGYFNNTRMKKHLRKSGLINKKGKILDEKTYRLNMAKKEHRKHVRDLLATAIIHKALDMERERQYEIRKRLDDIYKVELVRRVKVERGRKGDEHILPLLTPRERSARQRSRRHVRPSTAPAGSVTYEHGSGDATHPSDIHYDDATGKLVYTIEDGQETAMNTYLKDDDDPNHGSPYTRAYPGTTYTVPVPPPTGTPRKSRPSTSIAVRRKTRPLRFHYLARTEPAVAHRVQLQSMAEVTMKFLGPSLTLSNSMFPEDRLSEVMVLQQHCGGSTLCVFRELLPPNTIFTFISRRHRGSPFGLTIYIDSLQDIRLSACCEYKHKPEHILGGRNGHFQFVQVEGAAPCYRCQVASGVRSPKHKENGEQEEEEDGSKAFMTQDEDDNQSKQSFDVIITKVDPNANSDNQDKTADDSTQTPRDEKEDIEAVKREEKESAEPSATDEEKDEKYDDEKFEDEDDQEKEKEEKQEDENKEEDEKQTKPDDYNDDFDSEHEEPSKESADDEDETIDKNNEKKDSSDSSSSSSSDSSDDSSSDSSDEDNIRDDTEKKEEEEQQKETKEEEPEEVLDETEQNHKEDKEKVPEVPEEEDNNDAPSNISNEVSLESVDKPSDVPEETVPETTEVTEEPTTGVSSKEPDEISLEAIDKHSEVPEESKPDTTEATEEPPTDNVDAGKYYVDVAKQKEDNNETRIDEREHEKKDEELKPVTEVEDSVDVRPDDSLEVVSPEPPDTADSSSDSSSSSDSDREDDKDEPDHDPGNDPDLVAGENLPDQALKVIGVQPGEKHEGSIQPLVEGKKDIELTSLALDAEQIEELVGIIDKKDDVGSVTLRNTGITDSSIQQLVDVLKKSTNVKMLNLNVNSIGPDGAEHIANLIKENKSLRMLLLHGNPIQDTGAHRILDAIIQTKDTSLTNLDLGDCQMGDAGATDIARLLLNNTTITDLTISGNSIGLSGWRIISSAIEENTTLKSLSLDFSNIRDEEAVIIAEGLRENKGLRSLDLEGNKIGDEGGKSLLDAIKVNTTMVDLTLMPMNEISKDIYHEIKAILDGRSKTPSRISSANGSIRSHQTTTEVDNGQESEEATKIDDTEQESTHQVQSTPDLIERTNEVTQPDDVDTLQDSSPSSTQVPNEDSVEISQDPTQETPSSAQVPNEDGVDTSQEPTQESPSSAQVPNEDGIDTSQDPTQEPPSSIQVPNEQSVNPSQETTQEPLSSQPNEQNESERDDGDKVQNDSLLGNKQDV